MVLRCCLPWYKPKRAHSLPTQPLFSTLTLMEQQTPPMTVIFSSYPFLTHSERCYVTLQLPALMMEYFYT